MFTKLFIQKLCLEIKSSFNLRQPLKAIYSSKSYLWKSKPCLKIAVNTAVVMVTGDVIVQCFLESDDVRKVKKEGGVNFEGGANFEIKKIDWLRVCRFMVVGFFIAGPGMFYWYASLDRWIVIGSLRSRAFKKLAADQLLFLPFYILVYMVSMGLLRGDGMVRLNHQIQNNFGGFLIDSYKLWPAVQLVNFCVVPGAFRVPFINLFALCWNVYLGWRNEEAGREE